MKYPVEIVKLPPKEVLLEKVVEDVPIPSNVEEIVARPPSGGARILMPEEDTKHAIKQFRIDDGSPDFGKKPSSLMREDIFKRKF